MGGWIGFRSFLELEGEGCNGWYVCGIEIEGLFKIWVWDVEYF